MRFLSSTLFAAALVLTNLVVLPALANDPPKKPAAKEEPPKPKFDYIEEEGEKGRSGYVYKRVAKPKFEEPETIPKAPFPEPPEPPEPPKKDDHGKKMTMAHLRRKKRRTTVTALHPRKTKRKKMMAMVVDTAAAMVKMPKSLRLQQSVRCTTLRSLSWMATTAH
jgi:hypothetical protein